MDRWDEVWDEVYIIRPFPDDEHQKVVSKLVFLLELTVGEPGLGEVRPGVNISDHAEDWTKNYRCPDVVVYLSETTAENRGAYWRGGPDFAVEVVSPHDRTREKIDFYAKVGMRELLIIDRAPWAIELYRLREGRLLLAGRTTPGEAIALASEVVPLRFRLVEGEGRPRIEVSSLDGVHCKLV